MCWTHTFWSFYFCASAESGHFICSKVSFFCVELTCLEAFEVAGYDFHEKIKEFKTIVIIYRVLHE